MSFSVWNFFLLHRFDEKKLADDEQHILSAYSEEPSAQYDQFAEDLRLKDERDNNVDMREVVQERWDMLNVLVPYLSIVYGYLKN